MSESKSKLGRDIKIYADTVVNEFIGTYGKKMYGGCISVTIGIGDDNHAELIMSTDAWEALKNGEDISIDN